jgi:ADP-ribose pyrophosphatase YjhB (NUDIX family)
MIKYVAGFLFDDTRQKVALILKNHGPAAIVGKWNAIGGKRVDNSDLGVPDESATQAMWREFKEEAGVYVENWELFLILKSNRHAVPEWQVDFFCAFDSKKLSCVHTIESEAVMIWNLEELPVIVPNLAWIIPMALNHKNEHIWVYEVTEKETFAA